MMHIKQIIYTFEYYAWLIWCSALTCAARPAGQYAVCIPTMREPITSNYPFQMPLINKGAVHFKVVKEP